MYSICRPSSIRGRPLFLTNIISTDLLSPPNTHTHTHSVSNDIEESSWKPTPPLLIRQLWVWRRGCRRKVGFTSVYIGLLNLLIFSKQNIWSNCDTTFCKSLELSLFFLFQFSKFNCFFRSVLVFAEWCFSCVCLRNGLWLSRSHS